MDVEEELGGSAPQEDLGEPWNEDQGQSLATLLALEEGPGSSDETCAWSLGRLDVGHLDVRLAAWRVARASMVHRCGETPIFEIWERSVLDGSPLSTLERRRLRPFLAGVYGTPDAAANQDHLEGYVAEILWHLLTLDVESEERTLRNTEGPSFSVTETGGDGLAIWEKDSQLTYCLWEIKKDTSSNHISRTIGVACRQLEERSEEYLAKYSSIGSRQHTGDLGSFYGGLVDLWISDNPVVGVGVSVATSRSKAPVRRSFGTLGTTFPEKADGRLEGLIVAIADFRDFATLVRSYVWIGHLISDG